MNLATPKYSGPTYATPLPPKLTSRGGVRPLVACVYWGDKYSIDYVRKLKSAVTTHMAGAHEFVCVTADPRVAQFCDVIAPPVAFEGWWQKIGLFTPGLFGAPRPVLYLDLDVVITGGLTTLTEFEIPQNGLVMAENFGPNKPHCAHNSSVMLWVAGDCTDIAESFRPEYMRQLHGDQCFIWRAKHGRIDNYPPGLVRSYKYDCASAPPPADTRVVVFHGKPDPHEVRAPWVRQRWHAL
jgi:hypothetical protein